MAKKIKYYDISNILSTNAQYMILLGQRANGKSYQAKLTALKSAYYDGKPFVYLRRWREDIKQKAVQAYFGDMPIYSITNAEWDHIKVWNGEIYFATYDEEGKEVKSDCIGRACALNESERYKSWTFIDYKYILFEEFITDKAYLMDEPRQLQQFVSTVARNDTITVLMIGNTLSRVCPYFNEWCLEGVLQQKQGTIEIYHYHTETSIIDIAVEYCANANAQNKMFFGQTAKQIISGEWDTKEVPKLPRRRYEYEKVYEVLLKYQKFEFIIELLVEPKNGGTLCHIYPSTKNREVYRIITDEFSDLPNVTTKLDIKKKPELIMSNCFRLDKVCYSDNLTGSDFNNIMNVFRIW
jgi:hypothetical protein